MPLLKLILSVVYYDKRRVVTRRTHRKDVMEIAKQ
jgi:hypothetical protein